MSRKTRVAKELALVTKKKTLLTPVGTTMVLLGATIAAVNAAGVIERMYDRIVPSIAEKLLATKIAAETYAELRQEAAAEED